jgi:hypothetical protein
MWHGSLGYSLSSARDQASADERWSMSYTSWPLLQLYSNIRICVHMRRAQILN